MEDGRIKPMNREIARENIKLFKKAMDARNTAFFLCFGTLLGAVRGGDFIPHDCDTDIGIMEGDRTRYAESAQLLVAEGFEFVRCSNNGRDTTFLRHGEYIDVCVASPAYRFPARPCWSIGGVLISRKLLTEFKDFYFLGEYFRVPLRYTDALIEMYGKDWRIEKKDFPSPRSFDMRHPFRSSYFLAAPLIVPRIPGNVRKRLKTFISRWVQIYQERSGP